MIVIIGKSGSGKSTITNILCEKYGFNKIVTTTTRPKRRGERQNVDYNFVSNETFDKMVADGAFIETQNYQVDTGECWRYGSPADSIKEAKENDIVILTPTGRQKLIDSIGSKNVITIYVYANRRAIESRLSKRGDKPGEINRRMKKDDIDFKNVDADFTVYNHYGDDVNEVASIVANYLSKRGC